MFQYELVCFKLFARNTIVLTGLLLFVLILLAPGARAASVETIGETFPASITPAGEFAEPGAGEATSISDDGRYVAFLSTAENLGESGLGGVKEAYVKDLETGKVELISRAEGVGGEPANESVGTVILAGAGRYAIFASAATNLIAGPPVEGLHVYRRDLQTGETALVDRVSGSTGVIVTREATADAVSADGRYVVFSADVEDLEDPAGSHAVTGSYTLYVRDMQVGTTTTVGRAGGAAGAIADEPAFASSISPDGRYVAFESAARNLVAGMGANTVSQIYLRDLQTNTTTLISKAPSSEAAPFGEAGNASSEMGMIAGAGACEVAFDSEASNLYLFEGVPVSTPQIYLVDLCSTPVSTTLISRADGVDGVPAAAGNAVIPRLFGATADGRYVLFSAFAELTGEVSSQSTHLYLRDLDTGSTMLVDRANGLGGAPANADPKGSAISANGCRIAFATDATHLSEPEPASDQREIYVRQIASCQPPGGGEHHEETPGSGGEQPGGEQPGGEQPVQVKQTGAAATVSIQPTAGLSVACVVPTMRALDLTAVKRKLSAAHCVLGRVAYHYNAIPKGRLVEQSLHQGTIRPAGTEVSIWLSKGHHRRIR
jgi:Tol biopolymer transport system component